MTIAAVSVAIVVLTVVLLARAYARQLRRNRRLRRLQEATLAQQLNHLAARVDDLRADVRQLAELNDAVIGQVAVIRRGLNLSDATIDLRDRAQQPRSWDADPPVQPPSSGGAAGRSEQPRSDEPQPATVSATTLRASELYPDRRSGRRRRVTMALAESRASLSGPFGPALLVETGEPMAWATRQA